MTTVKHALWLIFSYLTSLRVWLIVTVIIPSIFATFLSRSTRSKPTAVGRALTRDRTRELRGDRRLLLPLHHLVITVHDPTILHKKFKFPLVGLCFNYFIQQLPIGFLDRIMWFMYLECCLATESVERHSTSAFTFLFIFSKVSQDPTSIHHAILYEKCY